MRRLECTLPDYCTTSGGNRAIAGRLFPQFEERGQGLSLIHIYPVPEAEHIRRINAERGDLFRVSRNRHEMFCHRLGISAKALEEPIASALRVGHGLERREGL